ncbi:MAG TPA: ribose-phosphate pyrophosphokinase [Gemmatimonadales bacterium]
MVQEPRPPAFRVLAGTANPVLAGAVARALGVTAGRCRVERYPDGELSVTLDESVRGREVFLVQPTAPPVNDHLVELVAFADACRRASAHRVTAVMPYFGYARADRREHGRQPIMASAVAQLLQCAGVDHVITVDLHTAQIEGFFQVPVDGLSAVPVICDALRERLGDVRKTMVVVSPDAGRVPMANEYAQRLGVPLVVLHKRRESGTRTSVTHLVGDVRGRTCLLVDDMIATGGTLVASVRALRAGGADESFHVAATHGLFLGDALERLLGAGVREITVTDTVPPPEGGRPEVRVVSMATLLADAIRHQLSEGGVEG